jgi:hypothetical protein
MLRAGLLETICALLGYGVGARRWKRIASIYQGHNTLAAVFNFEGRDSSATRFCYPSIADLTKYEGARIWWCTALATSPKLV